MKTLDIHDPKTGELYLRRYILFRCKWFRIFIHKFFSPDKDRDLHNHPWKSISIILRGGYLEERRSGKRKPILLPNKETKLNQRFAWKYEEYEKVNAVGSINVLPSGEYHRITYTEPNTTTLVFAGSYKDDWGFQVFDVQKNKYNHVPWRTFLGLPQETELND